MADLWLKNPRTGVVWLVTHEDTQKRCLSEGYHLVPDPRLPAPAQSPEQPEALPVTLAASDTVDTQMAESADELAAKAEAAALAEIRERNSAARAAFGVAQAPQPAPNVRRGVKHVNS